MRRVQRYEKNDQKATMTRHRHKRRGQLMDNVPKEIFGPTFHHAHEREPGPPTRLVEIWDKVSASMHLSPVVIWSLDYFRICFKGNTTLHEGNSQDKGLNRRVCISGV